MDDRPAVEVFSAGRQAWKLRCLSIFSILLVPLSACWGIGLLRTFGLSPGDGGLLRPLPERLAVGSLVVLLGPAFAVGMEFFGRRYILRMRWNEAAGRLLVTTLRWWGLGRGLMDMSARDVLRSEYRRGRGLSGYPATPWSFVWVRRRRLPLILDRQGTVSEKALAARLLRR